MRNVRTPIAPDVFGKIKKEQWTEAEAEEVPVTEYLQLLGCILYAATTCKPNVAFAASALATAFTCPRVIHYKAALRVLRYLQQTKD